MKLSINWLKDYISLNKSVDEIADSLTVTQGVLPLNSFNHNIEFTQTSSTNAFGTCGIKV